jgi:peptide/nickel transport system permease protein
MKRVRRWRRAWFPLAVLLVLLVCAVFAPLLAHASPTELNLSIANLPPGSAGHLLGTDALGRDVLSRLIFGARTALLLAGTSLIASAVTGSVLGLISGYFGGILDALIMRLADVGLAFPNILTALALAAILGLGESTVILAVTVTTWPRFARVLRGDVLALQGTDFVTMAKIAGVSSPTIMRRHILPNVANTLMVVTALLAGQVILLDATLSFLGLGLPPGSSDWGLMVAESEASVTTSWWLPLFPGLAITVVVLALNSLGDWLRDVLDPRLRTR